MSMARNEQMTPRAVNRGQACQHVRHMNRNSVLKELLLAGAWTANLLATFTHPSHNTSIADALPQVIHTCLTCTRTCSFSVRNIFCVKKVWPLAKSATGRMPILSVWLYAKK